MESSILFKNKYMLYNYEHLWDANWKVPTYVDPIPQHDALNQDTTNKCCWLYISKAQSSQLITKKSVKEAPTSQIITIQFNKVLF